MSTSGSNHLQPHEAGTESREAQSAWAGGGVIGDARLSVSKLSQANEGSRSHRRPLVWAAAWVGGVVGVVAALILLLR